MLTDQLAALLVDHEPGWRLPGRSDLARRFAATAPELEAALTSLARLGTPDRAWLLVTPNVGIATAMPSSKSLPAAVNATVAVRS